VNLVQQTLNLQSLGVDIKASDSPSMFTFSWDLYKWWVKLAA